jgi:coenzyme F420 hydrogenase subunit beta
LISAFASFCLEREQMAFALHVAMDPKTPWINRTVQSRSREELIARCGSRYAPSSPCEGLREIEASDRRAVFIGKPCDAAAVAKARRLRADLDRNLGLVLAFFCAGTPSTAGTKALLARQGINLDEVASVRYRGDGWPGLFKATDADGREIRGSLTYRDSWSYLQKYRPFRCQLCPDGTAQFADISCGDAWHVDQNCDNPGLSLAIVRTEQGKRVLHGAMEAGYVVLERATTDDVISAQSGLLDRRCQLFGRLLAFRLLGLPAPEYGGFDLYEAWRHLPVRTRVRTVLGTWKRILARGLWRRQSVVDPQS